MVTDGFAQDRSGGVCSTTLWRWREGRGNDWDTPNTSEAMADHAVAFVGAWDSRRLLSSAFAMAAGYGVSKNRRAADDTRKSSSNDSRGGQVLRGGPTCLRIHECGVLPLSDRPDHGESSLEAFYICSLAHARGPSCAERSGRVGTTGKKRDVDPPRSTPPDEGAAQRAAAT